MVVALRPYVAPVHPIAHGQQLSGGEGDQPIVGIAVAPQAGVQIQSASSSRALQTTSYSISELQVAGRHVSLTISGRSDNPAGGVDFSAMHFDLVLSPDNQTLHGYCLTQAPGGGQERRQCTLGRQR